MKSRVKHAVEMKQIKDEDGKMLKASLVVERIMDAWNVTINSSTKELYVDVVIHFSVIYINSKYFNTFFIFAKKLVLCEIKSSIMLCFLPGSSCLVHDRY